MSEDNDSNNHRRVDGDEYKSLTHSRPEPSSSPPTERPSSSESQSNQGSANSSESNSDE